MSYTPLSNFSSFYVFFYSVFIADWKNRKDSEVEQRLSTSESRDEEVGEEQATRWYAWHKDIKYLSMKCF